MNKFPRSSGIVLILVWLAFLAWQFLSWRHECLLIEETVQQQARSVSGALTGGIRSHRRLGRFVQFQLGVILEALATTPDVLAVEMLDSDEGSLVSAGQVERLRPHDHLRPGGSWHANGFRFVERISIDPGQSGEAGGNSGLGRGGFGSGRWEGEDDAFEALRQEGGEIVTVLLLDRTRADALLTGAVWSHAVTAIAGGLVLLGLGFAWRSNLRLLAEKTKSEMLRLEAQHFRDMGQSAAGLAHETRNPLGTIRGWAERLASTINDPETQKQQARILVEECDRVTARINEFLAFTRPYQPEVECFDLQQLLAELAVLLEPDLETKSMRLRLPGEASALLVRADRELLRQALFNLAQNAIQSSPTGEEVEIGIARDPGGTYRIEVADRGPGVPADQAQSLFTPYFTTRASGTGLGLAIVRKLAIAQGWSAGYRPRDGGGSVFSLEGVADAE